MAYRNNNITMDHFDSSMKVYSDADDDLVLLHYGKHETDPVVCSREVKISDTLTAPSWKLRGGIFVKDTYDLLVSTSSLCTEINVRDEQSMWPDIPEFAPGEKIVITDSYEGTLVRVYFYKTWRISTHRKLNAFNSAWGNDTSFGQMFVDFVTRRVSMSEFYDRLDPTKVYTFLVRYNENTRIVSDVPAIDQQVLFVGKHDLGQFSNVPDLDTDTFEWRSMFETPKTHTFAALGDAWQYTRDHVDPHYIQGLIVFRENGFTCKLLNPEYCNLKRVRGNSASLAMRYLELKHSDPDMCKQLQDMFPSHRETFEQCDELLKKIAARLLYVYIQRNIHKRLLRVPEPQHRILVNMHTWHCLDRSNNIVRQEYVQDVIDSLPAYTMRTLLRSLQDDSMFKPMYSKLYIY